MSRNTYVSGKFAGLSGNQSFIDYSVLAMNGLADVKKGSGNKEIRDSRDSDIAKLPIILQP